MVDYSNENIKYPKMYHVRQSLNDKKIENLKDEVFKQFDDIGLKDIIKKGTEIAVTAGSRGIANYDKIIRYTCDYIKTCNATPFIVPSMGSHGGATAEGQVLVLKKFGITQETMDCEIRSSMDTVQFENTKNGAPVFMDKNAYEADGIISVNRVKPHTDFIADNESGIVKMVAVGLGKQKGASAMHNYSLTETIPLAFDIASKNSNLIAGLAIVENSKDETYIIKATKTENFVEEEKRLLETAYEQVPKLPFDDIDVLVVKEMGKQYSGTGMDTKVIGRIKVAGIPEPKKPNIKRIAVFSLSNDSYGNALGIGLADITTKKVADSIDFDTMYSNLITTTFLERGKVPVYFSTEKECIDVALGTIGMIRAENAKIMIIENTLHLGSLYVSESIYNEIRDKVELINDNIEIKFDFEGNLEI